MHMPGPLRCLYVEAEYVPETKGLRWGLVGEQAPAEVEFSVQQDGKRIPGGSGWSADSIYHNTRAPDLVSNRSSRAQLQPEQACGYTSDFIPCYHTSGARNSSSTRKGGCRDLLAEFGVS